MLIFMWILVLQLDPTNFMPDYRTPRELEVGERAFFHLSQCEQAKEAMTWGVPIGNMMSRGYVCVYEEVYIAKEYLPL